MYNGDTTAYDHAKVKDLSDWISRFSIFFLFLLNE